MLRLSSIATIDKKVTIYMRSASKHSTCNKASTAVQYIWDIPACTPRPPGHDRHCVGLAPVQVRHDEWQAVHAYVSFGCDSGSSVPIKVPSGQSLTQVPL